MVYSKKILSSRKSLSHHTIEKRLSKTEQSERMFHGSNELCKARTHRRCVRAVFFRCCFAAGTGCGQQDGKISKQPIRHGKKTAEVVQPEIEKRILKDPVLCYTGR